MKITEIIQHLVCGVRMTAFIACLLGLCGCSSFNHDWRRELQNSSAAQKTQPAGAWEGTWNSEVNRHHGKLQCLLRPVNNSLYEARFRAAFGGIFHFTYTARFELQPHDTGWEFNGEANLGKLGGVYYYEGRASATNLVCLYRSSSDHGRFQMLRPTRK